MTKETKLGIFVFAGIFCFILTIVMLGDFQFQPRYTLNITFHDIAGLPAKAKVKIAGVEVGSVKNITLAGNKAKVTVWINRTIEIHADAHASIVATGIIGSKYLELTMGTSEAPVLNEGDTIAGIDPVSFDKLISDTMERIDQLVESFQGNNGQPLGKTISETLENLRDISGTLRRAISEQENKVVNIVDNVNNFTGDLADMTADNKEDIHSAIIEIRSVAHKMDSILERINSGEGTIGKLVSDKEMGENLKETVSEVKETAHQAKQALRRLNLIETDWNYEMRYDATEGIARNDVGLYIKPHAGKYYYLGVTNVGDPSSMTPDSQAKNTLNFLFGQQWTALEGYAGMIRTTAGLGIRVRPLYKWDPWKRLELTVEGFDFGRETPIDKPVINVGARFAVTNWAFIGLQQEDVSYNYHTMVYGNVILRDDDIAYILGLVGLARP
ncbi:MAG: MlaD family protein [Endomicrobiales bacterium]|jgi:phospholipid/cholesterol/gamma-HCH transport system substrate-binding protein